MSIFDELKALFEMEAAKGQSPDRAMFGLGQVPDNTLSRGVDAIFQDIASEKSLLGKMRAGTIDQLSKVMEGFSEDNLNKLAQEIIGIPLTDSANFLPSTAAQTPMSAGQGAELGMQMMAEQQAIDEATKAKEMQEVEALLGVLSEQSSPSTEVFAASGSSSSLPANTKGSFSKTSSIGDKANLKSMMDLGIPEKEAGAMLKQGLTPIEAVALYKEYRTESEDKKMQTLLASLAKGEGREGIAQLLFALFSGAIKPEEMNASLRASFLKDLENK